MIFLYPVTFVSTAAFIAVSGTKKSFKKSCSPAGT
jgi:hypothetical protein